MLTLFGQKRRDLCFTVMAMVMVVAMTTEGVAWARNNE